MWPSSAFCGCWDKSYFKFLSLSAWCAHGFSSGPSCAVWSDTCDCAVSNMFRRLQRGEWARWFLCFSSLLGSCAWSAATPKCISSSLLGICVPGVEDEPGLWLLLWSPSAVLTGLSEQRRSVTRAQSKAHVNLSLSCDNPFSLCCLLGLKLRANKVCSTAWTPIYVLMADLWICIVYSWKRITFFWTYLGGAVGARVKSLYLWLD